MNRKILQKVIDELNKESPKLDYVKGILETVLESLPEISSGLIAPINTPILVGQKNNLAMPPMQEANNEPNEGNTMDLAARARLGNVDFKSIQTE